MAYDDWQLPFGVKRMYDVLRTPENSAFRLARERFPRPNKQRMFQLVYQNITATDLAMITSAIDATHGAAVPITLTLPAPVGTSTFRFDDDGYEIRHGEGETRDLVVNLIEEVV